jgi:hypothetical protein
MRLFVSAFLLAAAAAGFAQSQAGSPANQGSVGVSDSTEPVFRDQINQMLSTAIANTQPSNQVGCPVVLTGAHLNWPASYLPVTSAEKITEPSLALGFHNASGKGVRSVTITARFLGKKNVYNLDANAFDLRLTFDSVATANKVEEQMEEIQVPAKMYAYGVTRVSLERVTFADGTFWISWGHGDNCSLDVKGSAERVAK